MTALPDVQQPTRRSGNSADLIPLTFHAEKLRADPTRVVVRPFELAWQQAQSEPTRAHRLVNDICTITSGDAEQELERILGEYEVGTVMHLAALSNDPLGPVRAAPAMR